MISRLILTAALSVSTVAAKNVYEATVDRKGPNQEGKRFSPPVEVKKLIPAVKEELHMICGVDFEMLPELPINKEYTKPWYPFEMRRNGQTATVTCVVLVSPKGSVEKIYRIGEDSDLFFKECARAMVQWKIPASIQPTFYRISFTAGLFPATPTK